MTVRCLSVQSFSLNYMQSSYIHKTFNMLSASVYCKMDIEYEKTMYKAWTNRLKFEYSNPMLFPEYLYSQSPSWIY